jgi:hypothetical protein
MAYTYMALPLLGAGQTGLTIKAALYSQDGTIHATLRDLACTERAVPGTYLFRTASMPDDYEGTVVFYVGTLGAASDFSGVMKKHEMLVSPREVQLPFSSENADKLLGRNLAGSADGGRTVRDSLRAGRNKIAFDVPAAGQFTVYAEDDTTPAWTGTYSRSATIVNALTGTDPA